MAIIWQKAHTRCRKLQNVFDVLAENEQYPQKANNRSLPHLGNGRGNGKGIDLSVEI